MEASTLRWIILLVGVLILGAIFMFGSPKKSRKPRASRRGSGRASGRAKTDAPERLEPTLEGEASDPEAAEEQGDEAHTGQGELDIDSPKLSAVERPSEPPRPRKPAGPPPDKIITLFLLARDNHRINGAELLQASIKTGMQFGDMDIFHRLDDQSEKPVFSLVNAAKPGHFDRDGWNTFETTGVALFMTLPNPMDALDAWDAMLATARRMADVLQADLLDDERKPFTRQREAEIRETTRDYDRSR